jgi:DNA-binding transcriptional LysR family regulator
MNRLHFNALDLNLLRVFDALMQERSVSRAGVRLGLSQSAVSHALGRLRQTLGDELFSRGAAGMRPTRRALEIGPAVHAALLQVQGALAPQGFDPATAAQRFTLIAGAYAGAILMPGFVAKLRARAPRADLRIVGFAWDLVEALETGRADGVIGAFEGASERYGYRRLFRETMVWVVRSGHPLAEGPASIEALAAVDHVVIDNPQPDMAPGEDLKAKRRPGWEDVGGFERELARLGLHRRVGVVAADSYSALAIVAQSDMAALAPRRLAERAVQRGMLHVLEPPHVSPPVEVGVLFLRDRAGDAALAWMLDLLAEAADEL